MAFKPLLQVLQRETTNNFSILKILLATLGYVLHNHFQTKFFSSFYFVSFLAIVRVRYKAGI